LATTVHWAEVIKDQTIFHRKAAKIAKERKGTKNQELMAPWSPLTHGLETLRPYATFAA
jgi:hypothetical protein